MSRIEQVCSGAFFVEDKISVILIFVGLSIARLEESKGT